MSLIVVNPHTRGTVSTTGNFVVTGVSTVQISAVKLANFMNLTDPASPLTAGDSNTFTMLGTPQQAVANGVYHWAVLIKMLGGNKDYLLEFTSFNGVTPVDTLRILVSTTDGTSPGFLKKGKGEGNSPKKDKKE